MVSDKIIDFSDTPSTTIELTTLLKVLVKLGFTVTVGTNTIVRNNETNEIILACESDVDSLPLAIMSKIQLKANQYYISHSNKIKIKYSKAVEYQKLFDDIIVHILNFDVNE